jgi:aminoglycoside 3-N-acetyltransferase I
MIDIRTRRLIAGDRELARRVFVLMAEAFEEECQAPSDPYVDALLCRADFWAIAAFVGDEIVGGLTAHTLPLTRAAASEVFIYDVAVRDGYRRKGVGRQLMTALRDGVAAALGIEEMFVPADNEDTHALDFYRALGGVPSPVTFFSFTTRSR